MGYTQPIRDGLYLANQGWAILSQLVHRTTLGKPKEIDAENIISSLLMIESVDDVHSLRMFSLTTDVDVISVHLVTGWLLSPQKQLPENITHALFDN